MRVGSSASPQNYRREDVNKGQANRNVHTRTSPDSFNASPWSTSAILAGFTGRGSITSVNSTPRGTVFNIRANSVAQVDANSSGDLANLSESKRVNRETTVCSTHEDMVAFPSLAKMRLSEFVVSLAPTTRGYWVVPEIYSVALQEC